MSTSTKEQTFEIEKILDHVSILEAYEQFYKDGNQRYAKMWTKKRCNKSTKSQKVMNYFFLVKWVGYSETTWEPENNIPESVYLYEYKTLNNLKLEQIELDVSFPFKKGTNYVAPTVFKETFGPIPKPQFRTLNKMSLTVLDYVDNGKFGVIPVPEFKRVKLAKNECLEKGNNKYLMKNTVLKQTRKEDIESSVKKHHKEDKSFLQGMIKHSNIVKMLDFFYIWNENKNSLRIFSIYEFSSTSLRQRIESDGTVEWKKVAKDMLSALSFIHSYGIHQAISVDSIFCHGGEFKLSNFNRFTFKMSMLADEVKSSGVEYAPRKYGLSSAFNYTMDIFALAVVLLQCHVGLHVISSNPETVLHLDNDLCQAIVKLDSLEDHHFIMMMIEARIWIDRGAGDLRCQAKTLRSHPVLQEEHMKTVECFFLPTLLHSPFSEHLFYKDDDTVEDVMNRLLSLYQEEPNKEYLMALTKNVTVWEETIIVDSSKKFKDVVEQNERMELIVFPIIKLYEEEDREIFIISYEQELGGCPIIVHTKKVGKESQRELESFVYMLKNAVVSKEYRDHPASLKSCDDDSHNHYADTPAVMELYQRIGIPLKNRFVEYLRWEKTRLSFDQLQWEDLAGTAAPIVDVSDSESEDSP